MLKQAHEPTAEAGAWRRLGSGLPRGLTLTGTGLASLSRSW
jgi:hypothetical protein